jgi:hypothetical protein
LRKRTLRLPPSSPFSLPNGDLDFEEIILKMNWIRNPALPVPPQIVRVSLAANVVKLFTAVSYDFS